MSTLSRVGLLCLQLSFAAHVFAVHLTSVFIGLCLWPRDVKSWCCSAALSCCLCQLKVRLVEVDFRCHGQLALKSEVRVAIEGPFGCDARGGAYN
mmetsp:Transcript_5031/g.16358  ORF Transcript_5031/g.16358 Transcript_5031/m.16358 type:complete len:95 (+) Transcript_5031:2658-2942(+)